MPELPFASVAFLWPSLAAASASQMILAMADGMAKFAQGVERAEAPEPEWETPNAVALELPTMRLRDFSTGHDAIATLVCTPFALHDATIVDLAQRHSLVVALAQAGLTRLFVSHWRSATPSMRFLSIDSYLADLNVVVDELGGKVNLIGLCQGGWLALAYSARFANKVQKLVLAAAPVDIAAGESKLSRLAASMPLSVFSELVRLGEGRIIGARVRHLWGPTDMSSEAIGDVLQIAESSECPAYLEARFRAWHAWTVNLPGTYYLQVVERLYKCNQLARGQFVALGRCVDLRLVRAPLFLLAAEHDEVVSPEQLFAVRRLVGTKPDRIDLATVPCGHLGLFMGSRTLERTWPRIVRWLLDRRQAISRAANAPVREQGSV